ncbi:MULTISPECIES: polysaccharide deacetylase [unclassified Achromobacter]|uniref:polysaccharide deacetylase n=1 Tax=unclassified Achromobacter TaxID=2626865 RepID=UPI000B51D42F|nr:MULTISPECIES: polysaccharide deacetylase [unclassified Achromobacter]OWT72743.1 polysaccharide deacetylase [Achromobacter sp. HZ34]OWT73962.1 polysaccharide deacetylase [Achromobacter sp. HZ28]
MPDRYALITVDTEALPKRAPGDHVKRLMWGEHKGGTAGVREMCRIGDEFGAKHVFFMDLCGAYDELGAALRVARWLHAEGQDVQLHAHPEYLPMRFWDEHGLAPRPQYMNQYTDDARTVFILRHFGGLITGVTGKAIRAFRAGSFRWNASTIRALEDVAIPLSFNNSMCAVRAGQCPYAEDTNVPYAWSNGVIEIPMTEKRILPSIGKDAWWARLTYPESSYFRFRPWWGKLLLETFSGSPDFSVFLLHSWSLLYWDEQGYGVYRDDQRLEGYRKLMQRLTRNYEVITTADLLDLRARGKIATSRTVPVERAENPDENPAAGGAARASAARRVA